MEKTERNYSLDFLKILATVAIVFHHFQQIANVKYDNFINFYGEWFNWGNLVEFFFILSGYFMYRYIPKIKENSITLLDWWKKRALRLLPMVAISVLAFEVFLYTYNKMYQTNWLSLDISIWGTVIASLGIQDGWGFVSPLLNNPIWYISVLLACYIIFYILTSISAKVKCSPMYFYAAMIFVGVGIVVYQINLPFLNSSMARGYYSFFFGLILVAYINKYGVKLKEIILSVACLAFFTYVFAIEWDYADDNLAFNLTFLVFPALIMLFETGFVKKIFRHKIWGTVSAISFEVYLWHLPMLLLSYIFVRQFNWYESFETLRGMFVFLGIVCAVGTLIYFLVERPIVKLINSKSKK